MSVGSRINYGNISLMCTRVTVSFHLTVLSVIIKKGVQNGCGWKMFLWIRLKNMLLSKSVSIFLILKTIIHYVFSRNIVVISLAKERKIDRLGLKSLSLNETVSTV